MSEWKRIDETTPTGHLLLGKWIFLGDERMHWTKNINRACEVSDGKWPWSIPKKTLTFDGTYYTHWKSLPEPPND